MLGADVVVLYTHTLESRGTVSCTKCGLVIRDSVIDTGQEWRSFDEDEGPSKSRIGGFLDPLLPAHEQMGTKSTCDRLNSRMAAVHGESHLAKGLRSLDTLAKNLHLPQPVVDKAREIYHAVSTTAADEANGLSKRYNVHALLVVILYYACRACGTARTFAELRRPVYYIGATKSVKAREPVTQRQFNGAEKRIKTCAEHHPWLRTLLQTLKATVCNTAFLTSLLERHLSSLRPPVPYKVRKVAVAALEQRGAFVAGHQETLVVASAALLVTNSNLCPERANGSIEATTQLSNLSGFQAASINKVATKLRSTFVPLLAEASAPTMSSTKPVKLSTWMRPDSVGGTFTAAERRQQERINRRAEARNSAVTQARSIQCTAGAAAATASLALPAQSSLMAVAAVQQLPQQDSIGCIAPAVMIHAGDDDGDNDNVVGAPVSAADAWDW